MDSQIVLTVPTVYIGIFFHERTYLNMLLFNYAQ